MNMKRLIALLMACCMIFALAACGENKPADRDLEKEREELNEQHTEEPVDTNLPEDKGDPENTTAPGEKDPEEKTDPLPTATSDDVELYVVNGGSPTGYVVNAYGQVAAGYSLDTDGNILDKSRNIIVASANAKDFRFIANLSFGSNVYNATLNAKEEASEEDPNVKTVKQNPVNVTLLLTAGPTDATNGVIVISSSNRNIAEIRANNNAKIIADGAFELETGEIAIQVSEAGTARIEVTAKAEGDATITAKALAGTALAECKVSVKNGEAEHEEEPETTEEPTGMIYASEDPTKHTHVYTMTVVPPTQFEKGYTLYTCECGHSYKDHFTAPIPVVTTPEPTPHIHHYTESVVAPTATERGYTLHVCDCGDSYKDCFVDPIGD